MSRGRGRASTLPAWMTKPGGGGGGNLNGNENYAKSMIREEHHGQFDDAPDPMTTNHNNERRYHSNAPRSPTRHHANNVVNRRRDPHSSPPPSFGRQEGERRIRGQSPNRGNASSGRERSRSRDRYINHDERQRNLDYQHVLPPARSSRSRSNGRGSQPVNQRQRSRSNDRRSRAPPSQIYSQHPQQQWGDRSQRENFDRQPPPRDRTRSRSRSHGRDRQVDQYDRRRDFANNNEHGGSYDDRNMVSRGYDSCQNSQQQPPPARDDRDYNYGGGGSWNHCRYGDRNGERNVTHQREGDKNCDDTARYDSRGSNASFHRDGDNYRNDIGRYDGNRGNENRAGFEHRDRSENRYSYRNDSRRLDDNRGYTDNGNYSDRERQPSHDQHDFDNSQQVAEAVDPKKSKFLSSKGFADLIKNAVQSAAEAYAPAEAISSDRDGKDSRNLSSRRRR